MHKSFTRTFLTLVLLSSTFFCYGQTDSINIKEQKIKWLYTSIVNQSNNETLDISGYFVTNASSIEWVQENGGISENDEMTVSSLQGSWVDVNETGEIQFNVSLYGNSGTVIIKRVSGNKITISLEFIGDRFEEMRYQFDITDFELIN